MIYYKFTIEITLCCLFVIVNQTIACFLTHRWYKEKFASKYPSKRKAIIPYLLWLLQPLTSVIRWIRQYNFCCCYIVSFFHFYNTRCFLLSEGIKICGNKNFWWKYLVETLNSKWDYAYEKLQQKSDIWKKRKKTINTSDRRTLADCRSCAER